MFTKNHKTSDFFFIRVILHNYFMKEQTAPQMCKPGLGLNDLLRS